MDNDDTTYTRSSDEVIKITDVHNTEEDVESCQSLLMKGLQMQSVGVGGSQGGMA